MSKGRRNHQAEEIATAIIILAQHGEMCGCHECIKWGALLSDKARESVPVQGILHRVKLL